MTAPWWARPTAAVLFGGQAALAAHVRDAVQLTGQTLPADLGWSAEETLRGEHL